MSIEQTIEDAFLDALRDWDGQFAVELEYDDRWDGYYFYSATIKEQHKEKEYYIPARLRSGTDDVEMEMGEDAWYDVTMANVFAALYFQAAA